MLKLIMGSIIAISLTFLILFNFRYPKRVKKKNVKEYQEGSLNPISVVKRMMVRMIFPSIPLPVIMLLFIIINDFNAKNAVIVYGAFSISTLIAIIMVGLGVYYYKHEFRNVFLFEMVFIKHQYDVKTSTQFIASAHDNELNHATMRVDELNKTIMLVSVLQTLLCFGFLFHI